MNLEEEIEREQEQIEDKMIEMQLLSCEIDDDNLLESIGSPEKSSRYSLNLYQNSITFVGVLQIVSLKWTNLVEISLNHNNIGCKGVKYLTGGDWPDLNGLYIGINQIRNEGVKHLVKGRWPRLNALNIQQNQLTDDGFEYLLDGNWNLKTIWLNDNKSTTKGFECLVQSQWSELQVFWCIGSLNLDQGCSDPQTTSFHNKLLKKFPNIEQ